MLKKLKADTNIITEIPVVDVDARQKTFQQGQGISIPCRVRGYPKPSVLWSKDGVSLSGNKRVNIVANNTLVISRAHPTDQGVYECVAWNTAGQTQKSVRLIFTGEKRFQYLILYLELNNKQLTLLASKHFFCFKSGDYNFHLSEQFSWCSSQVFSTALLNNLELRLKIEYFP